MSIQEQEERLSICAVIIKNLTYVIWLKHCYKVRKNPSRTAVKWKLDAAQGVLGSREFPCMHL